MKLWLVRHARPLIDAGVCYGATDVPADAQATDVCARALADVLPQGLHVRVSPLQRCSQLAQALQALRPDLHAQHDARLAEMDFGCWEGVRWDDIQKESFDQWTSAFGDFRFGGSESVNDLLQRVASALADTTQTAPEAVWLTHAGVARALTLLVQGMPRIERAEQWPRQALEWGQWRQLEL